MKITEMRLSVAKTYNLGNFNSIRVEAGLTVSVDPETDDLDAVEADTRERLLSMLRAEYRQVKGLEG